MEECQRCRDIDEDRRTLEMSCFYDMNELDVPFKLNEKTRTYSLRVCKDCRSEWMKAIEYWFHNSSYKKDSCGSGIFVLEFGAIVEISQEEWDRRYPGVEPVRFVEGSSE
ncbi:hypothetical protein UFOVP100_16 [uncultured Caudovirales phage]|uniref:Uncharacterized protein n=1 Tax=uncultured Caudovirales phage TaxID=2100421 RepID=A0A6J5L4J9_9CAUD|nr:hypothetical protein UFOVP100_16 [uncultured Caudovirales phage]